MICKFVDRTEEIQKLNTLSALDGMLIIIGRRRIGKTSLITNWLKDKTYLYSQAIQSSIDIQLEQIYNDFKSKFEFPVQPKSWGDFFNLLEGVPEKFIICIDEFPYLVKSDPTLPSIIQKWLDHKNNKKHLLVLTGSSTHMMTQTCLNSNSPLYGRARSIINLKPISYEYFCEYLKLDKKDPNSFKLYALTGGIPKYWENLNLIKMLLGKKNITAVEAADHLYFGTSPLMEGEVFRFLSDEKIEGLAPISVLEAIARGASKPSEVASRMGVPQTQLYKVIQQLLVTHLISKEIPYGASANSSKIVNLKIKDHSTLSWFKIASVHASRWSNYTIEHKSNLINNLVGLVFEDFIRDSFGGATRYWNSKVEIDFVSEFEDSVHVAEIKWNYIDKKDQTRYLWDLGAKVKEVREIFKNKKIILKLFDQSYLKTGSHLISKKYEV